ncbi:hypothetical protein [Burkholderia territorii]|uniref:hypothetical protein n=1 Tax=Burkholderia territorii TaxID=1503055 RepID=UPI0007B9F168|nr:hypothetical protein [Burkholderia territorii]
MSLHPRDADKIAAIARAYAAGEHAVRASEIDRSAESPSRETNERMIVARKAGLDPRQKPRAPRPPDTFPRSAFALRFVSIR